MTQQSTVVLIKSNLINRDVRLTKTINYLYEQGYKTKLISWDRQWSSDNSRTSDYFKEIRLRIRAPLGIKVLPYLPIWWTFIFFQLINNSWDIVHAINFDCIIPSLVAGKLKGKTVVYEIYDTYEDLIIMPRMLRKLFINIDKLFMRFSNTVIIVDKSRRDEFDGIPNDDVIVINNSPPDVLNALCRVPDITDGIFTIFYAGLLTKERSLNEIIEAVNNIDGVELVIAGFGDKAREIAEIAKSSNGKIRYLGEMDYKEVLNWNYSSDLMFSLYDPRIPLFKYASSNKLFEAMMCRKPILVSKGTTMASFVEENNCGLVVECNDINGLREAIIRLKEDPRLCRQLGSNGRSAYEKKYNELIMKKRLTTLYDKLRLKYVKTS
jgi:glycosyltransferase involved in cell wall biosynthesis